MSVPPVAVLRPGRERPVLARHPWVFSGSLHSVDEGVSDGDEVVVRASDGRFLGRGLFNGKSQIRIRLYRWEDAPLDASFFRSRIRTAVRLRDRLGLVQPDRGCRLVFSEGDGLSGLTVDRYGDWLAIQFSSLALSARQDLLLSALEEILQPTGVVLRTQRGVLGEEGLELSDGWVRGEAPKDPLVIEERGVRFEVDLRTGQKTGFYFDQRENRALAGTWAVGRSVADVFCYSGGFGLTMLAAGASSVVGVDVSETALSLATANAARNQTASRARFVKVDAFDWLEAEVAAGRSYGTVVVDPPRFARSGRGVAQALRGYRRLNELAIRALEADGILVTCSCSGRVGMDDFTGTVRDALAATGRRGRLLDRRGQPADHPVDPCCPETAYLKCLIVAVE